MYWICLALLLGCLQAPNATAAQEDAPAETTTWQSPVGLPVSIKDLPLAGPEREPVPQTIETPVVIRRVRVDPHGTAFRYHLEVYGLEPGTYDLGDYLQTVDGSEGEVLQPLPFIVQSVLPPGQVRPHPLKAGELPSIGIYRLAMMALGVIWILGLAAYIWTGRRGREEEGGVEQVAESAADRLRPLLEKALQGDLGRNDRARLELSLIGLWRERLDLQELSTPAALGRIREHPVAGPLLVKLEEWLHRPEGGSQTSASELEALLEPYRAWSAGELDLPSEPLEKA